MASHGVVLATIWRDDDFRRLGVLGQWLYVVLLSSPDRNTVGAVPLTPRRWRSGVDGLLDEDIAKALGLLVERGFVLVDEATEELIIRSYLKHDPPRNRDAWVGMWRQWGRIASADLRRAVVEQMTDELWLRSAAGEIPTEAHVIRAAMHDDTDGDTDV